MAAANNNQPALSAALSELNQQELNADTVGVKHCPFQLAVASTNAFTAAGTCRGQRRIIASFGRNRHGETNGNCKGDGAEHKDSAPLRHFLRHYRWTLMNFQATQWPRTSFAGAEQRGRDVSAQSRAYRVLFTF